MNENELEQLATLIGHTLDVHRSSYRLPDDVFQTAKIAKIVLLMEQGTLKSDISCEYFTCLYQFVYVIRILIKFKKNTI